MKDGSNYAYTMVIHPRKRQDLTEGIASKGMIRGPAVDMIDFVHGSFDFITKDDDRSD